MAAFAVPRPGTGLTALCRCGQSPGVRCATAAAVARRGPKSGRPRRLARVRVPRKPQPNTGSRCAAPGQVHLARRLCMLGARPARRASRALETVEKVLTLRGSRQESQGKPSTISRDYAGEFSRRIKQGRQVGVEQAGLVAGPGQRAKAAAGPDYPPQTNNSQLTALRLGTASQRRIAALLGGRQAQTIHKRQDVCYHPGIGQMRLA